MSSATYEFLTNDNIADYVRGNPKLSARIDADRLVSVDEIGDGNLNLVFILKDADGRGLVLKQALPYVRMTGEGWPMTPERAAREAGSLSAHHALVPELVVELIDFDPERYILALEDLSDHQVWRGALNSGVYADGAAEVVGRYVAAVAFGTSVLGMDRGEQAAALAEAVNPDLCTITEDLVFTEPVVDAGRNAVLPANEVDAADLAADPVFARAMGDAKWKFMTQAEALIHGDLHTGSVMVRSEDGQAADSVKVFDSEFAFYGPVAFDLGAAFANYAFAAARATALGNAEKAAWALNLADITWNAFAEDFAARAASPVDPRVWGEEFVALRLETWRRESMLFASAKMARRIVGAAKVADIETLDEELRAPAARSVLLAARALAGEWVQGGSATFADIVAPRILRQS